ncbi:LMF1 [Branchiostoma lanceolatum]|uniref:Lipase maturation factor n=1 Tax=Branchiostoma lanceolatum TaxID=7740 RepID=A0A8K0F0B6_BRALA|nr:LMF1 [Branchiostoma lanceolatum]
MAASTSDGTACPDSNVYEGLRHRKTHQEAADETRYTEENTKNMSESSKTNKSTPVHLETGTYWLTRIVFLRSLGLIYFVAFLVALHQNKQLLGTDGLLPANLYLQRVQQHVAADPTQSTWSLVPSLLWWVDWERDLDLWLDRLAYIGAALSFIVMVTGCANMVIMAALWVLYHSIVNIGQKWYSFGWESQLLETGFLAIFFCPLLTLRPLPRTTPPSLVVIWGYRWLIFRIMLGAGLIKIRGDQCWRDLTCMNYHYQTQPVPNPISYYLHQTPENMHKFETLSNHFVELVAPWFIFLTRPFRFTCGFLQILFQVILIISGNLSFLNWLTILPSICSFDDAHLAFLFPSWRGGTKWQVAQIQQEERSGRAPPPSWGQLVRRVVHVSLAGLIVYLSLPVVQNLLSPRQAMNTSFDPLRLVNTYGAFGSITKERTEVIFQGTYAMNPTDPGAVWEEYEFKCKPGNVTRRPCLISPYHYRLDWLMWFAAFQNYNYNNWLVHLAAKLLVNDPGAESLIAHNPFHGKQPPRFIRAEHYKYSYTKIGSAAAKEGKWWKRRRIGEYLPAVSLGSLNQCIKQHGWNMPAIKQ